MLTADFILISSLLAMMHEIATAEPIRPSGLNRQLPREFDLILHRALAKDKEQRNLQREARAHIEVQRIIDRGEAPTPIVSVKFILWVHREFFSRADEWQRSS